MPLVLRPHTGPFPSESRAGLQDNVPDQPSAKVAPVGCQLGTMAYKSKNCHYPKRWVAGQKLSPNLGRQCTRAELHETGGLSATLAVNRLPRALSCNPGPDALIQHYTISMRMGATSATTAGTPLPCLIDDLFLLHWSRTMPWTLAINELNH